MKLNAPLPARQFSSCKQPNSNTLDSRHDLTCSRVCSSLPKPRTRPLPGRHSCARWFDHRPGLPQYFSHSGYFLVRFADQVVAYFCASLKPSTPPGHQVIGLEPKATSASSIPKSHPQSQPSWANPATLTPVLLRGYVTIFRLFRRHQSPKSSPRAPTTRPHLQNIERNPNPQFIRGCRVRQRRLPSLPRGGDQDPGVRHSHPSRFPKQTPCRYRAIINHLYSSPFLYSSRMASNRDGRRAKICRILSSPVVPDGSKYRVHW